MDDFLKEALEIVKAQASVRVMSDEQIIAMVRSLSSGLKTATEGPGAVAEESTAPAALQADPRKSIKERSVTCLECGKVFKIISSKHLGSHGLTPEEYREKWGLKKGTPLTCKELQRARRKKMQEMKLWEKRKKVVK